MLKKLLINSLLLMIFPLLSLAESGSEKCVQKAEHSSFSLLLVDLSDKIGDADNFRKSIAVFSEMIKAGERVVIGISTDKVGDVKLLMDFVNPENSVWVSALKIRALQKTFKDCLHESAEKILAYDQKFDKSAILETINFTGKLFNADPSESKRLVIYSDMMQNSSSISFYNLKDLDAASLLAKTEKEELIPNIGKIDVFVAGIGVLESDKKVRQLEKYWKGYFEKAGAVLKYFGPILINLS